MALFGAKTHFFLRISKKSSTFAANFYYDFFRNDFFRNSTLYGKSV